jgi:hypothetical protein
MTTKPIIELDFDDIKADLITFIKSNPTFTDYNFTGSALNTLMDVLAYNTHTNAYYANMLHNESFIETAQKRSSIVSKAKELGYVPKSVAGSRAILTINLTDTQNEIFYLPRGSTFVSSNENGTFTFVVISDHSSVPFGQDKIFNDVEVVEGSLVSNIFTVNNQANINSIFTIPNENVDISTLKVYIKTSNTAIDRVEYKQVNDSYNLGPTDLVYYVQEAYDGYYQIYFGNDILGKQPINGNIVYVEYVTSANKAAANGCIRFKPNIYTSHPYSIDVVQSSYGGADKEDIESIRFNSIHAYSSAKRAVTYLDYEALIKKHFNFVKTISVWGGEEQEPPVYGKVFISIQPVDGYILSSQVKVLQMLPVIKSLSLMPASHVFVDPEYTDLEFTTSIKFNENKTITSRNVIDTNIKTEINNYVNTTSKFNTDFLLSPIIQKLAVLDPGISSVSITSKFGFKIIPNIGVISAYKRNLNNEIVQGSIYSSKFNIYSNNSVIKVSIKEVPNSAKSMVNSYGASVNIVSLGIYDQADKLVSDVGTVNLSTGEIDILLNVHSYISSTRFIYIRAKPVNSDLISKRNQIFTMQPDATDAIVGINSNNIVNIEIYNG